MIRGMRQVLTYGSSAARLKYTITDDEGLTVKPDVAPNITVYGIDGNELIAATPMTMENVEKEAYLAYDTQTEEFEVGRVVTGGTTSAKGLILADRKNGTSGILFLGDVDGNFQDNEVLTDDGNGSALVSGTLYTCSYYYDLDLSSKNIWPIGTNYQAKVNYAISGRNYTCWIYFDIAYYPMIAPIVTSQDVDKEQPTWAQIRPDGWADWTPAIESAHADLVRRIHAMGEQAARYVAREEEFWRLEMSMVKARIAEACGMPRDDILYWQSQAERIWGARGQMTFDSDDDSEIDGSNSKVFQSRFTR